MTRTYINLSAPVQGCLYLWEDMVHSIPLAFSFWVMGFFFYFVFTQRGLASILNFV
jgi:energy-converting hydrogenase Eha subunit G